MAAVSDVPDATREKMTVCARHRFSLEVAFWLQKATAKLLNDAFYAILCCEIKKLPWSDPGLYASFEYVGVTEERRRDSQMRARALNALEPAEEWRTAKEVAETMKVSMPTAREVLNVLFDYGFIEKDESGKTYKYRKASKSNV
jgi:Sugar-specific transcriptional regulator TrmB